MALNMLTTIGEASQALINAIALSVQDVMAEEEVQENEQQQLDAIDDGALIIINDEQHQLDAINDGALMVNGEDQVGEMDGAAAEQAMEENGELPAIAIVDIEDIQEDLAQYINAADFETEEDDDSDAEAGQLQLELEEEEDDDATVIDPRLIPGLVIRYRNEPRARRSPYYTRRLARKRAAAALSLHRCPICLIPSDEDDEGIYRPELVRELLCGHEMHRDCILATARQWNLGNEDLIPCPECRQGHLRNDFINCARPY